jgi:hypothetical protein
MAIIDLKTNLRNVKNTSKTQPYITKNIPSNTENGNVYTGVIGRINSKKDDVIRIGKFFTDTKNSAEFIAKSVAFHRMNPLTEAGEKLRTWTPLNVLSQVSTNLIGGHVNSFGLNPFDTRVGYSATANEYVDSRGIIQGSRLINLSKKVFIDGDSILQKYSGGGSSIFGIGNTYINRTFYTDVDNTMSDKIHSSINPYLTLPTNFEKIQIKQDIPLINHTSILARNGDELIGSFSKVYKRYEPSKENTIFRNSNDNTVDYNERINIPKTEFPKDFRAKLSNLINPVTGKPFVEGYEQFNLEKRVGLGKSDSTIGQLPVYYSNSPLGQSPLTKIFDKRIDKDNVIRPNSDYLEDQTRDLVRFRIELIDVDNPNFGQYIVLRSTIKGFTKSTTASWNSQNYVGRGDVFKTYSLTEETISFNFTLYAKSKSEMKIMYQKLNTLISGALYPSYSRQNKMRGSMVRITLGDLMENQPCIVTGFTLTIPDENSWEIAVDTQNGSDKGLSKDDYVLPMILEGGITITPIYNFLPQKSLSNTFFVLPNENIKEFNNLAWVGRENGDM